MHRFAARRDARVKLESGLLSPGFAWRGALALSDSLASLARFVASWVDLLKRTSRLFQKSELFRRTIAR